MNFSISICIVIALLLGFESLAKPRKKRARSTPIVFQMDWKRPLLEDFPKVFCEKKEYLRSCFHISQSDCLEATKSAVRDCIKSLRVPNSFRRPASEFQWAEKIGHCAGQSLEYDLRRKKKKKWQCHDVRKWM